MKTDLREFYGAPTRAAAEMAIDVFTDKYGAKYDKAVACLTKDRETLLAFFDFPAELRVAFFACISMVKRLIQTTLTVLSSVGR